MEPYAASLRDLQAREVIEAIGYISKEDPGLPLAEVEARLAKLWGLDLPIHERPLPTGQTAEKHAIARAKAITGRRDSSEGDDGFEDEEEGHYAPRIPICVINPSNLPPVPLNTDTLAARNAGSNTHSIILPQLQKGSDGLRDQRTHRHGNSVIGGTPLDDVKAIIRSRITAQKTLLEQQSLVRETPKSPASPRSSSSKGSPRPWPTSPLTPPRPLDSSSAEQPLPNIVRSRTAPLPFKSCKSLRAHSESPQRTCKRSHITSPLKSASYPMDPSTNIERGRSRLRRNPATRCKQEPVYWESSPGLHISKPMLQHPILVPGVCLDVGGESPLENSLSRKDSLVDAEKEGDGGDMAGKDERK